MFPYSDTNKRYHTFDYYCRRQFGGKVLKIPLNAGFTCPNLDGTKGVGGCIFCSPAGAGNFAELPFLSIAEQFEIQKEKLSSKWDAERYIPYFQAHTNTYAPLARLKTIFEEAVSLPGVVGLRIATRPDCLSDEIVEYLKQLSERTELAVELGLQTVHDRTAKIINRCYPYKEFLDGFGKLRKAGIPVCIHLINGLPGESRSDMLETAAQIADIHPFSVKLHLLHVLRETRLAQWYEAGRYRPLPREEYIAILCDQLELFPPDIVVERVTGDGDRRELLAPGWSLDKRRALNEIDKEMARRNTCQGIRYLRAKNE